MDPYPWPEKFNDTYDCMQFGYEESKKKMAEKIKQELIEYVGYGIAFIFILFFAGILAWLLAKWMGKV